MPPLDIYKNVNNVEYVVSGSRVICKVQLHDGTLREGTSEVTEKMNVYGYIIPDILDAKISAFENAMLTEKAV